MADLLESPGRAGAEPGPAVEPIRDWLIDQALLAAPVDALGAGVLQRLVAAGTPIHRFHLSLTTLDPRFKGLSYTWYRDRERQLMTLPHGDGEAPHWQQSPFKPLLEMAMTRLEQGDRGAPRRPSDPPRLRYRLGSGEGTNQFPVLGEFRAEGATDYLALATPFGHHGDIELPLRSGLLSSWTTDRPDGFTETEIEALVRLQGPIAAAARMSIGLVMAETLLATYLGADAGRRVLRGEIRRGMAQAIDAAILFADLRGFTALADAAPRDRLVALLDDYLDAMAAPIEAEGGQVLKFLGDGLLATFDLSGRDPAAVCGAALAAAREILGRVGRLNAARAALAEPVMDVDIALHRGEVLYGNVGSESRLEFTVIGPAVNEAARMEAACKELGCNLVVSDEFVAAAGEPQRFRPLGRRALPGIRDEQALFTPAA